MTELFGQTLRELRQAKGLSQRTLAKMVGVDFTYISKIENNKTSPLSTARIVSICKALSVDPECLLAIAGKMSDSSRKMFENSYAASKFISEAKNLNLSEKEWEQLIEKLKTLRF